MKKIFIICSTFLCFVNASANDKMLRSVMPPEHYFSISLGDFSNTYYAFKDSKEKSSYLDHILSGYQVSYDFKKGFPVNISGKNKKIVYAVNVDQENSGKVLSGDTLGIEKVLCSSEMNKLFLNLGVDFEINYLFNNKLLLKKSIKDSVANVCFSKIEVAPQVEKNEESVVNNPSVSVKKEGEKIIEKTTEEPKKDLLKENVSEKKDSQKKSEIDIKSEVKDKNINKTESINDLKDKEEPLLKEEQINTIKKDDSIFTILEQDDLKSLKMAVKKQPNEKDAKKNLYKLTDKIDLIYAGLSKEEEIDIFKKSVAKIISDVYAEVFTKEFGNKNYLSIKHDGNVVIFNMKFSSKDEDKAKKDLKQQQFKYQGKSLVCDQLLLRSALDVGVEYETRYEDKQGNILYTEKVSGKRTLCLKEKI